MPPVNDSESPVQPTQVVGGEVVAGKVDPVKLDEAADQARQRVSEMTKAERRELLIHARKLIAQGYYDKHGVDSE